MSKKKFTTIEAAQRLMHSMEVAINNMIDDLTSELIQSALFLALVLITLHKPTTVGRIKRVTQTERGTVSPSSPHFVNETTFLKTIVPLESA